MILMPWLRMHQKAERTKNSWQHSGSDSSPWRHSAWNLVGEKTGPSCLLNAFRASNLVLRKGKPLLILGFLMDAPSFRDQAQAQGGRVRHHLKGFLKGFLKAAFDWVQP